MLDAGAAVQAGDPHLAVGVAHVQAHRTFVGNHAAWPGKHRQAQAGPGVDRGLALHQFKALAIGGGATAQAALRARRCRCGNRRPLP
ncbi:hypothetical protein G6F40_016401 [Rhizopus arrhizus]|nr:hypothetical protein G6F40_016401 [Rhizopus arrhizus]